MYGRNEQIEQLEEMKTKMVKNELSQKQIKLIKKMIRVEKALNNLEGEDIKAIRNANGFKLYPLEWDLVCEHFNCCIPFDFHSQTEFEKRLKEVCDSLYGWKLYEKCPKCKKGIRVPIWNHPNQWTPFCGCSEYPICDYSADREGKPIK